MVNTNKVVDFQQIVQWREEKLAYEWAISEQKRLACTAKPIAMVFESDCLTHDWNDCVVSIFINREQNRALLRRDWLNDSSLRYDQLLNLNEIAQMAPNSLEHMLNNAIKIYHYFDGPNGGITRTMGKAKEWISS